MLVKLESANPTGSMKDRAALAIVRRAAQAARLQPGDTIVECTSGGTGISLASVAIALGYKCLLVSSDAFSAEKLAHMQALGAELQILRSDNKKITAELVTALIEASRQLSQLPSRGFGLVSLPILESYSFGPGTPCHLVEGPALLLRRLPGAGLAASRHRR